MSQPPSQQIAAKLRALRSEFPSIRAYAAACGVALSTLQRWLDGGSFDSLDRVHEALTRAGHPTELVSPSDLSPEEARLLAGFRQADADTRALILRVLG